jgi:hypothetical protein
MSTKSPRGLRDQLKRGATIGAALLLAHVAAPTRAVAAPPSAAAPPPAVAPPEDAAAVEAPPTDPIGAIKDLEAQLEQTRSLVLGRQPRVVLGGYIDLGFFVPQGDGSGIVRDAGNVYLPQYAGQYGWVFMGDLLSPAVNSRGEVADLGTQATGAPPRLDSVHSQGAPGFIANEVNLTLTSGLGETAIASASVNFLPRSGTNFALGDFVDVDLAQVEWMPTKTQKTSFFVGKVDSVIGIEYKERKAPLRFGITPSLLARYTTGTALGLKVRHKMGPDDNFIVAAALTNGSFTTEQFHFYNEIDTNAGKTISGRMAVRTPVPIDVELGLSGSWGSQDRARTSDQAMWFYGVDLQLHVATVDLKGQYLRGKAPGNPLNDVYGLDLRGGAYLEADWMIVPLFGVLARGEYRDALVWLDGAQAENRLYVTKSWRATGGLRFALSDRILLKAEYLWNGEYGGLPQIKNNVFTTSLVLIN